MINYRVERATKNMDDKLVKELANISKVINVGLSQGFDYVLVPNGISQEATEYLKGLHYIVEENKISGFRTGKDGKK